MKRTLKLLIWCVVISVGCYASSPFEEREPCYVGYQDDRMEEAVLCTLEGELATRCEDLAGCLCEARVDEEDAPSALEDCIDDELDPSNSEGLAPLCAPQLDLSLVEALQGYAMLHDGSFSAAGSCDQLSISPNRVTSDDQN